MSAVTIKSVFKGKSLVELRYELLKIQKQILELRKQQVLRQLADRGVGISPCHGLDHYWCVGCDFIVCGIGVIRVQRRVFHAAIN